MPALTNHRQERFCQLVKQGVPPYRAYPMAGYKFHNGEPYRLRENPRVKRRLAELTKGLAMKARVTVESLTEELDAARELALRVDQPSAAIAATTSKAKLHGLMVDRKESGAPGDFASMQTPEAVIDAVRKDLGDAAADMVASLLAKQALPGNAGTATEALDTTRDPSEPLN